MPILAYEQDSCLMRAFVHPVTKAQYEEALDRLAYYNSLDTIDLDDYYYFLDLTKVYEAQEQAKREGSWKVTILNDPL